MTSPLLVIVGPTASGKSNLALEVAKKLDGEIICADARTIYKGMDIGTAKPSPEELASIPHHLLDIVKPSESFTAEQFKRMANTSISDISNRGKLPILVGGTGLYVDALIYDFEFRKPADKETRDRLSGMTVAELQQEIKDKDLPMPDNSRNPRHLMRVIETDGQQLVKKPLRQNTVLIGLKPDKAELDRRINSRVREMVYQGLRKEVEGLVDKYGWEAPGLNAIGYREWMPLFDGIIDDEDSVIEEIVKNTKSYAKRQATWFRRNNSIQWLSDPYKYVDITTTSANKLQ